MILSLQRGFLDRRNWGLSWFSSFTKATTADGERRTCTFVVIAATVSTLHKNCFSSSLTLGCE